ncbi:MAG: DUF1648 domain-containing protein [Rhodanobacteraceae bacterium]
MKSLRGTLLFVLALACAAIFVFVTGAGMPELVAAHFDASGAPDGFMPRSVYLGFVIAMIVVAPLLLVLPLYLASSGSGARLNLPRKDYWLHPERRARTVAYLRAQAQFFAVLVVCFLAYVHWLVVGANTRQPPLLSADAMSAGLAVLAVAGIIWLALLYGHFKRGT